MMRVRFAHPFLRRIPVVGAGEKEDAVLTADADLRVEDPKSGRRPPKPKGSRRGRRRFWLRRVGVLLAVLLLWLTWSIGGALTAPGTDSTSARLAEWARFNGLGWVVSGLEQAQYKFNPPKMGAPWPVASPGWPWAGRPRANPSGHRRTWHRPRRYLRRPNRLCPARARGSRWSVSRVSRRSVPRSYDRTRRTPATWSGWPGSTRSWSRCPCIPAFGCPVIRTCPSPPQCRSRSGTVCWRPSTRGSP